MSPYFATIRDSFTLPLMTSPSLLSDSEKAWLERRAADIARETGEPLPVGRSEAMAQLVRLRALPKADVIPLRTPLLP